MPKADNPALQRRRDYAGPALFAYGFRPFFLAAGCWAAIGILLWVRQYFGEIEVTTSSSARSTGTSMKCCTATSPRPLPAFCSPRSRTGPAACR